ncbi:pyrroline-5-carboxylate reductase dimerization domain-containing protein [Kitasatospora sp. NPDC049285]|uniref:pyrroline-5-carboxylate reductase family protein n=1 Tax=Kitasatospora sp. NPDC049285 TaxID=3157096 RepID=UPI0034171E46
MTAATAAPAPLTAVIGAGHLGEAVLARLLAQGHPADRLRATTGTPAGARLLTERHAVQVDSDNGAAADGAEVLILTVRPDRAAEALAATVPRLAPGAAVLSFVAGLGCAEIARHDPALPDGRRMHCVRAATNTASVERGGLLAVTVEPGTPADTAARAAAVLATLGATVTVAEAHQDTAAAALGSGAAFLALAAEGIAGAARGHGVGGPEAHAFAADALESAAALLRAADPGGPAPWTRLATPGGITEAGLARLVAAGTGEAMAQAVRDAARRCIELRTPLTPHGTDETSGS